VFRSQGTRHGPGAPGDTTYHLARPGAEIRGRIVHGEQPDAVLYLGGNAEQVTWWRERFAAHVPDRATYLVAYRGYGASSGEPSERVLVEDALAVYDDLAARHDRVAVIGRSLGSGVAVQVAAARTVDRLVLVTPFDSLVSVVRSMAPLPEPVRERLPVRWLLADRFDSYRYAERVSAPTLVLRAGRDAVVLPAHTDRLLARLPAAEVVAFADADHRSISERTEYWESIGAFLRASEPVDGRASRPSS